MRGRVNRYRLNLNSKLLSFSSRQGRPTRKITFKMRALKKDWASNVLKEDQRECAAPVYLLTGQDRWVCIVGEWLYCEVASDRVTLVNTSRHLWHRRRSIRCQATPAGITPQVAEKERKPGRVRCQLVGCPSKDSSNSWKIRVKWNRERFFFHSKLNNC